MALTRIGNQAIVLDAAEIPNIPADKITSGSMSADRIGSGTFADARIAASNVSQHATSFDDNKIVNDISTLAIRQASNENKSAYNTNSMFVDVFQDSSAINLTNVQNVNEYLASAYTSKTQFVPSQHRTSTHNGALGADDWTGGTNTANSQGNNSNSQYSGTIVNELWDLAGDWQCKFFTGNSNRSGNFQTLQYLAHSIIFTTNTSLTAGSDPDIFTAAASSTAYGSSAGQFQDDTFLTSAGRTGMSTADLSNSGKFNAFDINTNGAGAKSYDANGTTFGVHGYYNDTNAWAGFKTVYDKSAATIVFQPLSWDGSSLGLPNNGITTISNVPSSGRALIVVGDAINHGRNYQMSFINGNVANDDYSYKSSTISNATGTVISNAITAASSISKMGAIITYENASGVNALNSDIVLQLSADGGSNFSTATLTALPDFATGIKMAKVNDLSVTAGTSLKYKISFANQASGSKEARIRGVSLQY